MTTVRIAHAEPWPGQRVAGRKFGFFAMLVVLADDSGVRQLGAAPGSQKLSAAHWCSAS